jgi:hypothetical protein
MQMPLADIYWICLYTDGVMERTNFDEEQFGEARVVAAVSQTVERLPEQSVAELVRQNDAFANGLEAGDDLTILMEKELSRRCGIRRVHLNQHHQRESR